MSEPIEPVRAPAPQETDELLRRILRSVEESDRKQWVEYTVAVVLALATTASAWCAYEASRWSGVQTFRLSAANRASREAASRSHTALQERVFDAEMFVAFITAHIRGEDKVADFLHQRFRPEAKVAVDAWLRTDPDKNPNAPKHPFLMPEYALHHTQEAKELEDKSAEMMNAAQQANQNSDRYVLLTVLFAGVLFFGGIAGRMQSYRLRVVLLLLALIQFVVTIVLLGTMPYCRE